jgi:chromosomal replication initiator protein
MLNPYIYPGLTTMGKIMAKEADVKVQLERTDEYVFLNIQQIILGIYGLEKTDLVTRSRKRKFAIARQLIFTLALKNTKLSLAKIGDEYNRDHATVLYSNKAIFDLRDTNLRFREFFDEISRVVTGEYSTESLTVPSEFIYN